MAVKIRKYRPADESDLKKCISELKACERIFDEDYLTDDEAVENLLVHLLKTRNKGGQILVAEVKKKVVGFISLVIENKNDELIVGKQNSVHVSDLVILPEFRGKNIGKMLLEKADEFAKSKGIAYIKLVVFAENKSARTVYERMGYKDYEIAMLKEVKSGSRF